MKNKQENAFNKIIERIAMIIGILISLILFYGSNFIHWLKTGERLEF